jgi:hypothetical protein
LLIAAPKHIEVKMIEMLPRGWRTSPCQPKSSLRRNLSICIAKDDTSDQRPQRLVGHMNSAFTSVDQPLANSLRRTRCEFEPVCDFPPLCERSPKRVVDYVCKVRVLDRLSTVAVDLDARENCPSQVGGGLPRSSGPVTVLVHDGSWRYGRGGRRSGSGWRSRPLHHHRGRGAIAQR